jgi:UDP-glucose 4-epimerase
MRILIAGGFGFVGGRIARQLFQAGHQVILGSRHSRMPPDWLPDVAVAQTEWRDEIALEKVCTGVDVVIQAAGVNAQDCAAHPVTALEVNGLATARLYAAASRAGVNKFLYISTAHVYGSPLAGIITEEVCPRNLHPYATSHLAGENAVLNSSQKKGIQGIVLRLSNAFGEPVHKDVNCWMLLLNDLCRQAVETGKMVLQSSGFQYRDFITMSEVCRIIEHLATHELETNLTGVFNVGSGASHSVLDIAKLVQRRCKLTLGFEPELLRPEAAIGEKHEGLTYKVEKLEKLGLKVSKDFSTEIDQLLKFFYTSNEQRRT